MGAFLNSHNISWFSVLVRFFASHHTCFGCEVRSVQRPLAASIQESGYDILTVDGSQFSGNAGSWYLDSYISFHVLHKRLQPLVSLDSAGPPAQEIGSDMQISWVSDHSVTNSGWEICVVFLESESWLKFIFTGSTNSTSDRIIGKESSSHVCGFLHELPLTCKGSDKYNQRNTDVCASVSWCLLL